MVYGGRIAVLCGEEIEQEFDRVFAGAPGGLGDTESFEMPAARRKRLSDNNSLEIIFTLMLGLDLAADFRADIGKKQALPVLFPRPLKNPRI